MSDFHLEKRRLIVFGHQSFYVRPELNCRKVSFVILLCEEWTIFNLFDTKFSSLLVICYLMTPYKELTLLQIWADLAALFILVHLSLRTINQLPVSIRTLDNLTSFARETKRLLMKEAKLDHRWHLGEGLEGCTCITPENGLEGFIYSLASFFPLFLVHIYS